MVSRKGFTLVELMVVVLIVGVLAAVSVPLMRGRVDAAKWSEANAAAGTIRTAVRAYWAEKGPDYAGFKKDLEGDIKVFGSKLGFTATDLDGRYFLSGAYKIDSVNADNGTCQVTVTATGNAGPGGAPQMPASKTLTQAGDWQ